MKQSSTNLSALQQTLLALREMRAKLKAVEAEKNEPIAIIGMSCRLPDDVNNPEHFWELLREGVDAVIEVPKERWDIDAYYDPEPETPGKMYTRYGSFVSQVDQFDPLFFGISPREASSMDPQHRLLLELSWEALERSGYAPRKLPRQTGVFIGMSENDYSLLPMAKNTSATLYDGSGNDPCFASGRLSYILGIQGPNLTLDTACSSSSVALHLAVQSLQNDECDVALAGGIHLNLSPETSVLLSQSRALSPDGRCKTFDATADGYGRGEGGGIFVLKRLSKAKLAGDNILAVIRGTATNHDGRSSGLTVPNKMAQEALMRQALKKAQVTSHDVSFVETHGTGTSLGDPLELRALDAVFGKERTDKLQVGSVKTNIGHLEGASGVASLMKVVLALQHREIPRNLHLQQLNPHLDWDSLPISVPTEHTPWTAKKRIAGVSSFGLSGTNVHMVLEEATSDLDEQQTASIERPLHLLTLSAKSAKALVELATRYTTDLTTSSASLANICFTANTGRTHFEHRLSVIVDSKQKLHEALRAFSEKDPETNILTHQVVADKKPKIAFLFTGQGSQYINMGRIFYATQPIFCQTLEQCNELLQPHLERSLFDILFPTTKENQLLINETAYAQPALFSLAYALHTLWQSWGVEPAIVMGHSVGEYVAACVAGVFSLEDGLRLITERGRLMQRLPKNGKMIAVQASEARVNTVIQGHQTVSIAALNGPQNIVISGESQTLEAIVAELQIEGIKTKELLVSHAFHSPLMQPILAEFKQVANQITYHMPTTGLISNVTGQLSTTDIATADYWCKHIERPVLFANSMSTLQDKNIDIFIEIGAQPVLLGMGRQCLPDHQGLWLPSLRQGQDDWQQMLNSLERLYLQGVDIDWLGFEQGYHRQRVVLPTYPFQRERYWSREMPLVDTSKNGEDWSYTVNWQPQVLNSTVTSIEKNNHWLIISEHKNGAKSLMTTLEARGQTCTLIAPQASSLLQHNISEQLMIADYQNIIYLSAIEETQEIEKYDISQSHCSTVLALLHALNQVGKSSRLWLLTQGSQAIDKENLFSVEQAPLWGLARTIRLEYPELSCVCIDLEGQHHTEGTQKNELLALSHQLLTPDDEDQIAFRDGKRYVARLATQSINKAQGISVVSADKSYLITGGLGGLGLLVARQLVEKGARYISLTSRQGIASPTTQKLIQELEQIGAKIAVIKADVAHQNDMVRALDQTRAMAPLGGVIHAAGVLDDGILLQQSPQRFAQVMLPKTKGSWHLHTLTQDDRLDFFILFSSVASMFGSSGQSNYAAANAFLDALAHYRQGLGLAALSINWGPWADIGMAAKLGLKAETNSEGMQLIDPQQGGEIFANLLQTQATAQLAIMPVNLAILQEHLGNSPICSALLPTLTTSTATVNKTPKTSFSEHLDKLSSEEASEILFEKIKEITTTLLHLAPTYELAPKQRLFELGMDSLMAIELRSRLQTLLQHTLPATIVFDYPSVEGLTDYIKDEILCFEEPIDNEEQTPSLIETDGLETLSDDELEALLMQKISTLN